MALQASGQIKLSEILTEGGVSASLANASLGDLEAGTVFTINTASASKPNGSAPNSISEWYSYDHGATSAVNDYYMELGTAGEEALGGAFTGNPMTISGTSDLSVSGWWRMDGNPTTAAMQLCSVGNTTDTGNNQVFFQYIDGALRFRPRFNASFHQAFYELGDTNNTSITGLSGTAYWSSTNRGNVNSDGFVHLAFTYDASQASAANGLKVYWNGSLLTQASNASVTVALRNTNSYGINLVTVGGIASNTAATNTFIGGIDEWTMYNSVLTSGNVTTIYNSGAPISSTDTAITTNLICELTFEGTIASDGQGNYDTDYETGAIRVAY